MTEKVIRIGRLRCLRLVRQPHVAGIDLRAFQAWVWSALFIPVLTVEKNIAALRDRHHAWGFMTVNYGSNSGATSFSCTRGQ